MGIGQITSLAGRSIGQGGFSGIQGIRQPVLRRTGAQSFGLAVIRGPAHQKDKFKRGNYSTISSRVMILVKFPSRIKYCAGGWAAQPGRQCVGFAHGAQVPHQMPHIGILNPKRGCVRHRQGKPCAL